ncbi:MAG: hypothetical protein R2689_10465 [Microthrixaceae bacterium]
MTLEFRTAMQAAFPGSIPAADYLDTVRSSLGAVGFDPETTLPLVSICRDELTTNFFARVQEQWGPAFTLAGLGGVPALGATGWGAAFAHIPYTSGRGSLLVFGLPHIGIEDDGTVGMTVREGQDSPTSTCGALTAIYDMSQRGTIPNEVDLDDFEATKLALRLVVDGHKPDSLVDLTVAALDATEVDLWAAIDAQEIWMDHNVAVCCGVQIHGHGGKDWVWPRSISLTDATGERRQIDAFTPTA